jgi:hypothetical protein
MIFFPRHVGLVELLILYACVQFYTHQASDYRLISQTDRVWTFWLNISCDNLNINWVIIKKHALFCYYAIKRQISTKLIEENMFCMKAHQLSIVLPSKSRLVKLRIYTSYTKTCFFLGVTCYFSRMTYFWSFVLFRCYDFIWSLYYFWTIPKTLIAQHYFCLIYIEI